MFASSPLRTACLLLGMLGAFLGAAWGDAGSAAGKAVVVPAATLTISVSPVNDAPTRVESALRFLEDRGEAEMARRIRTMTAEGRVVTGDSKPIRLDSAGPNGKTDTPVATAQAFRLAVTLSHFVASEDPIFDRWGNLHHAVEWLDQIRLKVAESNSPVPRDRKAWARSISDMASFTETFFTQDSANQDWLPFPSEARFHAWCSDVRKAASGGGNTGRNIERGTVGSGEGPAGPAGTDSGPGSPDPGAGGGFQGGDAGAGGPSVGAPMP